MNLQEKIEYSVKLIKEYEKLDLSVNTNGYHLAFSGGKEKKYS